MKDIKSIQLKGNSNEELLSGFFPNFPYIASKAYLNQYCVTWHWHKAVEIFYMESGTLEYITPNGKFVFPEGSGGFVNSGILHTSRPENNSDKTVQLLHIFDTSFLAGYAGSLIESKYIAPIVTSPSIEVLPIYSGNELCDELLDKLKRSFAFSENDYGYEIKLREILSDIWLQLLKLPISKTSKKTFEDNKIKSMMIYIYNNYGNKIRVSDIAASAFISERECYRIFNQVLHTTPNEYLTEYRIAMAARMLSECQDSITNIGFLCGFGSTSLFSKIFKAKTGYTPVEWRKRMAGF